MSLQPFPRTRSALARTILRRHRLLRLLPLVLAWAVATGCATTPEPPFLLLGGSYTGSVSVQAEPRSGTLVLVQDGADLQIELHLGGDLPVIRGVGTVDGTGFRGQVRYTADCPGEAVLEGDALEDRTVLEGRVTGSECGEAFSGTFRFRRAG